MKSFINWMGGKGSLKYEILSRFPKSYERYIEVFGGGGSILFEKSPSKFEVYNDFNNNLVNLFKVVKYKPIAFLKALGHLPFHSRVGFEDLINHLNYDLYGDEYYKEELELCEQYLTPPQLEEVKRIYETRCEDLDVERAVTYYKIIMSSYGAGGRSVSCQPINIRKTFQAIDMCSRRLANVFIENKDFEALIKHYDREGSFFYLDPPYWESEGVYSNINFTRETHERLRDTLKNIKGKFMLSYNDCPEIRELYKDFIIIPVERMNNLTQRYEKGSVYKEVLILNYEPEKMPTQMKLAV